MAKNEGKVKLKQARNKLPQKRGWKLFFTILGMLIWVSAAVIASQFIVGYLMVLLLGAETFSKPVPTAIYSALSYVIAMFLIIYIPSRTTVKVKIENEASNKDLETEEDKNEISRESLGLRGLPTWTDIGLAPIGLIVSLLLAAGLVALFNLFPWFNAEEAQSLNFSIYTSGLGRVIAFLTLIVVAPIAEEIIFRGWLYGKLREKTSGAMANIASIIISSLLVSLLFGLVHLQWNVGITVFAMSLVMCSLREITGTIYAGILVHMLKNGIAFYLLYILGMV